ncbi:MAG: pantoate--beta-alanine ligase [Firmicutes bacterium]|nr:pantoate--beta-alanine ligase [Bacillota bacterium]
MSVVLLSTVSEVRNRLQQVHAQGASIALVPTMGALHGGHQALIRHAAMENDFVVVSDFVNPTQFGPNEDFARYPRDLQHDQQRAAEAGAHLLFLPSVEEIYPTLSTTFQVDVGRLGTLLCGASRPGHFNGVATVVLKLLEIVQPERVYFGQKDFQQARIIEQMIAAFFLPVQMVVCPTVREVDGLALSSRNRYLNGEERVAATALYRSLLQLQSLLIAGERDPRQLSRHIETFLGEDERLRVEYVALVDPFTLEEVQQITAPFLCAMAVHIGNTRLIDNMLFSPHGEILPPDRFFQGTDLQ